MDAKYKLFKRGQTIVDLVGIMSSGILRPLSSVGVCARKLVSGMKVASSLHYLSLIPCRSR